MRLAIATAVGALLFGAPSPSVGQEAADPPCCQTIANSRELYDAFAAATDGVVNVCASATPIAWDETDDLDALGRIYLNNDNDSNPSVNPSVASFQLLCVRDDEYDEKRCVVDFAPTDQYDPTKAYGGFVLQNQRQLVVDGFEFKGHRGQNQIFYNQDGSKLTIRKSVFTDNGSAVPAGKNPVIVYTDADPTANGVVTIEDCLFTGNEGPLLGFQAGDAILKNNIFHDNTLATGYDESQYNYASFISWTGYKTTTDAKTDNTFKLEGNVFDSFAAPSTSSVVPYFFWMISAGYKKTPEDTYYPVTADELFAGVALAKNCASNNVVAGNHPTQDIADCNAGVFGYTVNVCRPFTGTCPAYSAASPPNKPLPSSFCASSRRYFLLDDDCKALDFDPDTSATLVDTTSPAAGLAAFDGADVRPSPSPPTTYTGVPPLFYSQGDPSDPNCRLPTSDEDPDATYPGQGCTCFQPDTTEVSYFDVTDQTDPSNAVTGYKTAFDTSFTGGVSIAGWFRAGETPGQEGSGQQTSLIFSRGKKSSWKHGYNFGMGKWNSFVLEVVLKGGTRIRAQSPVNSFPGEDVWHYVVGIYDAEMGRISIYVDNKHVGSSYAPVTYTRSERDIKWTQSCFTDPPDCELDYTRIGNGYDANDKNFRGCTGGFKVYGKALQVSTESPTSNPTESPTKNPSASPTQNPTNSPTKSPSASPSASPTSSPTESPNLPAAPLATMEVKVMHKYIVPKATSFCGDKPTCWVEGTASVEIVEGSGTVLEPTSVQLSTPPGPFTAMSHAQCSGSCFAKTTIEGLEASKEVVDGKARIMVFTKQLKNGSWISSLGRTWQPGGKKKRALRSLVEESTDDVTVYMPETFVVDDTGDGNQTTVPLVFTSSSDTDLEIDVCMYAPEGYQLDSVLDEAGSPIEEDPISCIHVLLASKDQTFLFEMTEFADVPARGRMLKGPPAERDVASLSVKLNNGKEFKTKLKKGKGVQKKLANLFG